MVHSDVSPRVLTFDIGTSSVKAGLFDRESYEPVWTHRERLEEDGRWVTERWVSAIQAVIDQAPQPLELSAIALSGNGPTVVPVGSDGRPLADALLWSDTREIRLADTSSFFLQKVKWITHNLPQIAKTCWQFMTCPEYLTYLLGGAPHTTSPSPAFDQYVWTPEEASRYEIPSATLPPIVRPGEPVGTTSGQAHALFGLPVGVPLYAAGPDFLMSLLGTATVSPGTTCDRAGTSEGINHCSSEAILADGVRTLPHVVPQLWNIAGILSSTGRIFEWFRSISRQQAVSYDRMLAEIEGAGFEQYPFFFPSMHQGAAWEFSQGMFVGLRSDHGTPEMGRGVVHAIGYAVRQSVERLGLVGAQVTELRACGGQAKNAVWNQMKADIIGMPVICPATLDAELVGNLCCALAGAGDESSPWSAARRAVRFANRFEPRPDHHERFSEGYERYLKTYGAFLDALHSL
jgi:xylulokinase